MRLTILAALFCAAATSTAAVISDRATSKPLSPIQANLDECKGKANGTPCLWHSAPNRPQLGEDGKGLKGSCIQITLPHQPPQPMTCISFALWKRVEEELNQ